MKINILEIPEEGIHIDEQVAGIDLDSIEADVRVEADVTRALDDIVVRGNVSVSMGLQCGRCLEDFRADLEVPLDLLLRPKPEVIDEEDEDDTESVFYEGEVFDLAPVVKELLVLSMPIKPLCDEACKGLCPKCGQNLNEGKCGCVTTEIDQRFSALKDYLDKKRS